MIPTPTSLIYGLYDPETAAIRYVGQTRLTLKERLGDHCGNVKKCHVRSWIKGLQARGLRPEIRLLAEAFSQEEADRLEQEFIASFKAAGCQLTNHHEGGQGKRIVDQGTKDKIGATQRGRTLSPEHRAKISAGLMGNKRSPHSAEARLKISQAQIGKTIPAEAREKISRSLRGVPKTPEHAANIRAGKKGTVFSDEWRGRMSEAGKARAAPSAETRQRISVASKAMWARRKQESGT